MTPHSQRALPRRPTRRSLHVWIVLLLLALLPLRGWAAAVMAVSHGADTGVVAVAVNPGDDGASAMAAHPCHGEMQAGSPMADDESGHAQGQNGSCPLCVVCHSSVAADTPHLGALAVSPVPAPGVAEARFGSAELPPPTEPPLITL